MRNTLRTFVVGMMIVALSVHPAFACQFCGGGYFSSYAPVYDGGCGGIDGGCGGFGWDDCGGGCGGDVVIDDGCCGNDIVTDDCCGGGCDTCGEIVDEVVDEGVIIESAEPTPIESAPLPPADVPAPAQPQQPPTPPQPATVERPAEAEVAPPSLPPEPTPAPPGTAPAEPAADLFGPPPTEAAPVEPAPTTPPATPATEPAAPATEPAAPAETPAAPPAEDDLFGGASTDAAPADTEAAPAETPAPTEPAAPAEGENAAEDDLFGSARGVLREAGGLDSNEMRLWVDNTGKFTVNARLVRFLDGHVRLMKDSGRTTTVPLARLSERDLEFVNRQASAQKVSTMQTAQASASALGIAN